MKQIYFTILAAALLLCSAPVLAQVGVGTTAPDAQLDVRASSQATPSNTDGMLIPKVDAFPATNPTAAQQGMLVYLTTATVFLSTTRQPGFYYWNNPSTDWIGISSSANGDHDWYEEGTTTAPDAITDDMFHTGNVAIGKLTADYPLDVETTTAFKGLNNLMNNSTAGTEKLGIENTVSGSSADVHYGMRTTVNNSGNGNHFGNRNNMVGTGSGLQVGTFNDFNNNGTGSLWATYNRINNANNAFHYGVFNDIFGDGGEKVGVRNLISGNTSSLDKGVENLMNGSGPANQIGTYNTIGNTGSGTHYGSYNNVANSGSGTRYGSYNDIGATGAGNHYGTYNTLSGNGGSALTQYGTSNNISKTGTGTHIGTENLLSGSGNGIKYGTLTTLSGPGTGNQFGSQINITNSGTATHTGAEYNLTGTGTGARYGISTTISNATGSDHYGIISRLNGGGAGTRWGTYNTIGGSGTGQQTAVYNLLNGSGAGTNHGVLSLLSGSGAGQKYGIRNELTGEGSQFGGYFLLGGAGTGVQTGLSNEITNSSNSSHYGVLNSLSGAGTGTKMGMYSLITPAAGGTHYAVYAEALKPGATNFAGYFLGNVGIGTTIGNTYTLPASRGLVGQTMRTDGLGNVTWANNSDFAWSLSGNSTAAANFIGTTNAQAFRMYSNNVERMRINPTDGEVVVGAVASPYVGDALSAVATAALPFATNGYSGQNGSGVWGEILPANTTAFSAVQGIYGGAGAGAGVLGNYSGTAVGNARAGVFGVCSAPAGTAAGAGVYGYNAIATGNGHMGVLGTYNGATFGIGVHGVAFGGGIMTGNNDVAVVGWRANNANYSGYFNGNHVIANGTKTASVGTSKGNQLLYVTELPEVWFEDVGGGQLANGTAHIQLDPLFLETIFVDQTHPMRIFLQEEGESNGLIVIKDADNKGFTVKEKNGGTSNISFSFRIMAKRLHFQDHRFGNDPLWGEGDTRKYNQYATPPPVDYNENVQFQERQKRNFKPTPMPKGFIDYFQLQEETKKMETTKPKK